MTAGFHDLREEILERVWNESEEGKASAAMLQTELAEVAPGVDMEGEIQRLAADGLITARNGSIELTAGGAEVARHVVRAHRLAARLLADLLELPAGITEGHACRLEHAISPELADSLCTLLGHPPSSPDGRPIPRGSCCTSGQKDAAPAVFPLHKLELGGSGRIVFIHARRAGRMDALVAMGLVPGTDVRLKQKSPAVVVESGETTLAMDPEMAQDLYVKPIRPGAGRSAPMPRRMTR